MLVLPSKAAEPAWTPVLGGEVLFAPITRDMVRLARRAARDLSQAEPDDSERSPLDMLEDLGDAFSHALIVAGAKDWRGVTTPRLDEAGEPMLSDGEPVYDDLAFTSEALALALTDSVVFDAFDAAYVRPFVERERKREAPGKGSPRSPDTTGATETQEPTIAGSRATASAAAAKNAPIGSTSRKPKRKKASGAS